MSYVFIGSLVKLEIGLVSEGFWNTRIPAVKVGDSEYAVSFGKAIRPRQSNNGKL
jgi:hypothetical protein